MCGEIMKQFKFGVFFVVYHFISFKATQKKRKVYMKPVGNYDNEYLFHSWLTQCVHVLTQGANKLITNICIEHYWLGPARLPGLILSHSDKSLIFLCLIFCKEGQVKTQGGEISMNGWDKRHASVIILHYCSSDWLLGKKFWLEWIFPHVISSCLVFGGCGQY